MNLFRSIVSIRSLKAHLLFLGLVIVSGQSLAQENEPFKIWLNELRLEAESRDYSEESISLAFSEIREPVARIVSNDRNQAEVVESYAEYLGKRVSEWKQTNGLRLMQEHKSLLDDISNKYNVQPRFIVAIWGMETNFGTYPITEPVFSSIATLAYDKRRADFYRAEFFAALTILDSGFPPYGQFKSSWAGAMGQSQFIPSSYLRYAVDQDGDGNRDIWNSEADALASIANYFSSLGWRNDQTWGRKVELPSGFNEELARGNFETIAPGQQCSRYRSLRNWRDLQEWQELGIRQEDGSDLPTRSIPAALILADEGDSEGYLVYQNFCTIMRFNPAFKYALSIGLLSDLVD
jgi:membrane-bound lytic murein transglycosylase B